MEGSCPEVLWGLSFFKKYCDVFLFFLPDINLILLKFGRKKV